MKISDGRKALLRTTVVLAGALAVFLIAFFRLRPDKTDAVPGTSFVEYERGKIETIVSDSTVADPESDNAYRGEQLMTVKVTTGRYAGETLPGSNYVGPVYGQPLKEGDGVSLTISTYENGDHKATVYEYDRFGALAFVVALFFLVTILVGGRTGAKSLVALTVTVLCLFGILLPALLKGAPTLPTVFLVCAYVAIVSFTILGGVRRKSIRAAVGTVAGMAAALLFALLAQKLTKIDGLRIADIQPILQLRQTGTPIGLKGLLAAGIVVSALGAVMDVAMSIASSLEEVHAANRSLGFRELFRSGMNIGRDMVGTMTNTLILAFLGSSFVLILYLYSLSLQRWQLLTSAYVAIEVISGVASSTGMILAIPLTALISSTLITRKKRK
jgi:uncharacterized membrane protein